ncbi:Transposase IS66 family protein [Aquisphaera giovannonii]|uniref:Transposase IS66 family protein n=1 Tax=Aquisphaera giovannonii TaxID=406548 RepID=A0A5B9W7U5_9BACT|nr:IS66 family transposase [Aquisphaera giovannonii]QEH36417.1 Transposase IS66 family protein [Aquisphaera giovannonii]
MTDADLADLGRDELVALILKQAAAIEALRAEIEALKRSGKRQAAPFSKGSRVEDPKRPGRKAGQGMFKRREAPTPEQLSEPPIEVPVDRPACPACGGELAFERVEEASVTDLPEVIRPRVRLFRVAVHRCGDCGATARGRHPDLAADQRGATAHSLGPRLLAAAHHLHYRLGVPVRKLPELLRALAGATLTQGAITRDALKGAAAAVGSRYAELCDSVRGSAWCHTDDTGWRQGGSPRWLMAFVTDTVTVYQVRQRHRNEEVRERIPADYEGTMITDRGTTYDAAELSAIRRQVCLAHVLRSISEVTEAKAGRARWFGSELKGLLRRALELWHERRAGPPTADYAARVGRAKIDIAWHLRDRRLADRDNRRLLEGLGRCYRAGSLVRFLDDPSIEPTNNRAERALRPAVIARKVSHCTKNARGTRAFEAWTSVLATLSRALSGPELLDAVVQLVHPTTPGLA